MARANPHLISALRETARRLETRGVTYKWSSFAHCNCGHLVQTLIGVEAEDLQRRAFQQDGDWGQKARHFAHVPKRVAEAPQPDFGDRPALDEGAWEPENVGSCQITGAPLDFVFDQLEAVGLETSDFEHLERLSSPKVRRRLGNFSVSFPHNVVENVVTYLKAWADLLEEELPPSELKLSAPMKAKAATPSRPKDGTRRRSLPASSLV